MTPIRVLMILIFLTGMRVAYEYGAKRGPDDRGYIGCMDGKLTMKNFMIDSLNSAMFHFGTDPCHGDGALITDDGNPPEKKQ